MGIHLTTFAEVRGLVERLDKRHVRRIYLCLTRSRSSFGNVTPERVPDNLFCVEFSSAPLGFTVQKLQKDGAAGGDGYAAVVLRAASGGAQ